MGAERSSTHRPGGRSAPLRAGSTQSWVERIGLAVALLVASLLGSEPVQAQADELSELSAELASLRDGATEAETPLLEQAAAALEAATDVVRDEAGQERARRIARAALSLVRARRDRADLERARRDAESRRDAARARRELAARRREASTPTEAP